MTQIINSEPDRECDLMFPKVQKDQTTYYEFKFWIHEDIVSYYVYNDTRIRKNPTIMSRTNLGEITYHYGTLAYIEYIATQEEHPHNSIALSYLVEQELLK